MTARPICIFSRQPTHTKWLRDQETSPTELRSLLPFPQSAIAKRNNACVLSREDLYISDGTISVAFFIKYSVAFAPPPYLSIKQGVNRAETLKMLNSRNRLTDSKLSVRRSRNIAFGMKPYANSSAKEIVGRMNHT